MTSGNRTPASIGTTVVTAPAAEKADAVGNDARGRLIFTRDRTHPTEAGHRIYAARLATLLPEFLRAGDAAGPAGPSSACSSTGRASSPSPSATARPSRW